MGTLTLWPGQPGRGTRMMPPHKVEPPQRAIFLAGRARAVAIVRDPFDMVPRLFLGRVIDYRSQSAPRRAPTAPHSG